MKPIFRNPNSGSSTVQTTPRKDGDVAKVEGDGGGAGGEEPLPHLTDINANPRLAQSTPQGRGAGRVDRELDSVSPVAFPEAGELASSMATSSSGESVELSQLYQDICDQKDIIMTCLEEDNCDIDQVTTVLKLVLLLLVLVLLLVLLVLLLMLLLLTACPS